MSHLCFLFSSRLTAFLAAALVASATSPASAGLIADYEFNGNLESSVGSAPDLIDVGSGAGSGSYTTATINSNTVNVFTFVSNEGLDFDNNPSLFGNPHTVAMLFEFDALDGFSRILNYQGATGDQGLYYLGDKLNYFSAAAGPATVTADQYYTVVMTNDGTTARGYLNGTEEFSFTSQIANATPSDVVRFFLDDGGENSAGSVARIQIFDSVLSPTAIASLDLTATIPEPSSVLLASLGFLATVVGRRRSARN